MAYKNLRDNRAYNQIYYEAHKEALKAAARLRAPIWQKANAARRNATIRKRRKVIRDARLRIEQKSRQKLKKSVIDALGGVCACCRESQLEFLAVDHIHGGGSAHTKTFTPGSGALYRVVRAEGFPRDRYQVLCHNCNWSKHLRGECVHKGAGIPEKTAKWTYSQKAKRKSRADVLRRLGGQCTCCSEDEPSFLTVDHVNEDGAEHRKKVGRDICLFLRKNNYPPGFQLLCFNCNRSKHFGCGVCVHHRSSSSGMTESAA